MRQKRQSRFLYRITKIAAWFYAKVVFKRRIIRTILQLISKKGFVYEKVV